MRHETDADAGAQRVALSEPRLHRSDPRADRALVFAGGDGYSGSGRGVRSAAGEPGTRAGRGGTLPVEGEGTRRAARHESGVRAEIFRRDHGQPETRSVAAVVRA